MWWEFTRCQRADGSHYGTAGRCQKGRQVDAQANTVKKPLKGLLGLVEKGSSLGEGGEGQAFDVGGGVVVKLGIIRQTEVKAMESLRHVKGVPRVMGFEQGESGDKDFRSLLAMTKAPGKPLMSLSKEDKSKAWESLFGIMAKVHKAGVAHNDLHGMNIFYDGKTQQSTLIDFGKSQTGMLAVINELGSLYGRTKDGFYNASGPKAQKFAKNYEKMWGNRYFLGEKKDYGKRKELMAKWVGEVYNGIG